MAAGLLTAALLLAAPGSAWADCKCLANGRIYQHGDLVCLKLPQGDQLARCDMVLNNSAWKKVSDSCPEASAGAVLAMSEAPEVSRSHSRPASPVGGHPAE